MYSAHHLPDVEHDDLEIAVLSGRVPDEFYVASGPPITTRRRASAPGHDYPEQESEQ